MHRLLAARIVHLEDVRGAGRRQRELELAEGELLDALQPQLDVAAHAAHQPALERLDQPLVHRLQRAHPVLRDAVRPAEVVDLHVGRQAAARGGAALRRAAAAAEQLVDLVLGERLGRHGVTGSRIGEVHAADRSRAAAAYGPRRAARRAARRGPRCSRARRRLRADHAEHQVAQLGIARRSWSETCALRTSKAMLSIRKRVPLVRAGLRIRFSSTYISRGSLLRPAGIGSSSKCDSAAAAGASPKTESPGSTSALASAGDFGLLSIGASASAPAALPSSRQTTAVAISGTSFLPPVAAASGFSVAMNSDGDSESTVGRGSAPLAVWAGAIPFRGHGQRAGTKSRKLLLLRYLARSAPAIATAPGGGGNGTAGNCCRAAGGRDCRDGKSAECGVRGMGRV
jgi:hypothetical protein